MADGKDPGKDCVQEMMKALSLFFTRSSSRPRRPIRSKSIGRIQGGRVAKRGIVKGYKGLTGKKVARKGVKVINNKTKGKRKKTLPVSRETLDKEIETFMKSR